MVVKPVEKYIPFQGFGFTRVNLHPYITAAGTLDIGPLDFNLLIEDPYAVLDMSLMLGRVEPDIFPFLVTG